MATSKASVSFSFTKNETLIIKAIGILLIVLHNFSRWVDPVTGESEFTFSSRALHNAFEIACTSGWMFFKSFFNYFGHYGVQLFIFISGYGLVQSYLNEKPSYLNYLFHRFQKLYPSFVVAIMVYFIYQNFIMYNFPGRNLLPNFLAHLSLTATLWPGKGLSINGPWWFYSTIFQLYAVFPILIKIYKRFGLKGLLITGLVAFLVSHGKFYVSSPYTVNLMETFIGQMPVFILGIWFGIDKEIKLQWYWVVGLLILFCGGCYYSFLWPATHLCIAILLLIAAKTIYSITEKVKAIKTVLIFIGSISVYLFAIHGFMRWPFVDIINVNHDKMWVAHLMLFLFLALSISLAWLLTEYEKFWRKMMSRFSTLAAKTLITIIFAGLFLGLIIWGYLRREENNNECTKMQLISHIEESADSTRTDIITYENRGRVLWFKQGKNYSPAVEILIPKENRKKAHKLVFSCNALYDSIPTHCWIVVESYLGPVFMKWHNVNIARADSLRNKWLPYEMAVDLNSSPFMRRQRFRYYFYSETKGNIYLDDIRADIE